MKTSRYSDSQIMVCLKYAEAGTPVPDLFREYAAVLEARQSAKGEPQNICKLLVLGSELPAEFCHLKMFLVSKYLRRLVVNRAIKVLLPDWVFTPSKINRR